MKAGGEESFNNSDQMKKLSVYTIVIAAVALLGGCSVVSNKFQVSHIGYENTVLQKSKIYALPRNHLRVVVEVEEEVFLPGPYADYAQKLLGIEGVSDQRGESHHILSVDVNKSSSFDPNYIFAVSILEGDPDLSRMSRLAENQLILSDRFEETEKMHPFLINQSQATPNYTDLTMESNVEVTRQTIYKTIITDTSFMKVPVTTEQLERKTLERKAEEAAKLILEIRTDRYYLSSGLVDPYPVNFDLKSALENLDQLEKQYLSLFIGKSFKTMYQKNYLLMPSGNLEPEEIVLDRFSDGSGFGEEGEPLVISIQPQGESESHRNLYPQQPEQEVNNFIYYRIPEWCRLEIDLGSVELFSMQTGIFQKGALVREKL